MLLQELDNPREVALHGGDCALQVFDALVLDPGILFHAG